MELNRSLQRIKEEEEEEEGEGDDMSLKGKDAQIKELERIIDYIRNNSLNGISFCGDKYGDYTSCKEYIEVDQDEGCIVCKMIHEYRNKYRQTKG